MDALEKVAHARQQHQKHRARLHHTIRQAAQQHPQKQVAQAAGLSQQRISQIVQDKQ